MGDQFEALRKALESMAPCGSFHKSKAAVQIDETEDWPNVRVEVLANKLVAPVVARYIAAANPDTIRALLAERDQLRTRVQELGAMARENRSRAVVELEAEMDKLRADLERTERNRDMWKEQCAQQAEKLETGILHLNAAQADARRLDWLTEQLVDTIYLDDGRIIDVGTGRIGLRDVRVEPHDLRAAIDQAMSTTMPSGGAL